jgi:steroid 5-alpha reductase family enzyme
MLELMLFNFLLLITCMVGLWLLSILLGDVSFVDSFWATGFVIVAIASYLWLGSSSTPLSLLLLAVTAIWGLRLGAYLFLRWRRDGADPRYVRMLEKARGNRHLFSLRAVFLLQGLMLWTVSLPVQLGMLFDAGSAPGVLAWLGVLVAAVGFVFETVGDQQMAAFRADPANAGQVMDRGLWRYTRHPNYFGDACVWWGLFLIAIDGGAPLWIIVGPALLNWTLLRWSGAALLERRLKRSRPGYEEYIARTSGFLPRPPRETS